MPQRPSDPELPFEEKTTKIIGEVSRIVFKNVDNGFHILRVTLPDGGAAGPNQDKMGVLTIKVTHPNIVEGITLEFHGSYFKDPKYGHQFIAKSAYEVLPSTIEGLIAYLSSSFFHGIGPVRARKIVNHFGDKTLDVFNTKIERILEVTGITEKMLKNIKQGWEANKEINEIMQFLMEYGMSSVFASKVYEYYGNNCVGQIKEDPYDLSRNIRGIGFKKADTVALKLGFAEDSPLRIRACIQHVLESSEQEGHCFLYLHQIISGTEEYLGFDPSDVVGKMLEELEFSQMIFVLRSEIDKDRYYGAKLYRNEMYCYEKVMQLNEVPHNVEIDEGELYDNIKNDLGVELSDQQRESIVGILRNKVSILTGSPGTGKTQSTRALVSALEYYGMSFVLCAPTGRAAKRMKEVIGRNAMTIHRTLIWDPINGGFAHGEGMPLQVDCIIIDEFSMVDIHLAAALLRATKEGTMVVFIGDPNQLPPVGPGNFFRDLIDSNVVKVFRLTQIFRQGQNSNIIEFSHAINRGEVPNIDTPLLEPAIWQDKQKDCLFIDTGFKDPAVPKQDIPKWNALRYGYDVLGMLEKIYKEIIPKYHLHPDDIQVLIPMKKGPIGTIAVNKHLQNVLNPYHSGLKEMKLGDRLFRENDKVIQLVNNYDLDVFNGDIGRIAAIDHVNGTVHINYDSDRVITYNRTALLDVDLGYAITIHRSQGSEFDFVILPIMNQYYRMLYRQLIYTALTRAKKLAVFIGQRNSLKLAVDTIDASKRQTSLRELLKGELQVNLVDERK